MAIRLRRNLFLAVVMLALSAASSAQISVVVSFGPPPLPVYVQPPCPAEGYIWTPGYWAWDSDFGDYYWVPGTWVLVPVAGYYWTPGWWGWGGSGFLFHVGYWGPVVGFYGGINYGFGYFGRGYEGGRWENDHFYYNRTVNNINVTNIHNVYNTTVINNTTVNRVSYNGGNGGITAQPTAQEEAAASERHIPPVAAQTQHLDAARSNPELRASVNRGKPSIAATPTPNSFQGQGVVAAKEAGGTYTPPPANRAENAVHPNQLPPVPPPPVPKTGNTEQDQKYQQQQEQLRAQQQQDRQKLQQQQEQEHQQLAQQQAAQAREQQLERQHQQQTQQMYQQHQQQQQQLYHQQQQQSHSTQGKPPKG